MNAVAVQVPARIQHILFATDFSAAAANAIPFVNRIAKHFGADVVALHVRPPIVNPMSAPAVWAADLDAARFEDKKFRSEVLAEFPGIRTKTLIEEGGLAFHLQNAIKENNIDLVVIGTRGRTGLGKLLMGSVAEEIFRTAPCPVLTVGPHAAFACGAGGRFREILFATDFNSMSQAAAAQAVSMAQEFEARLVMMHVIPEASAGDLVAAHDVTEAASLLLEKLVPKEARAWCKPEFVVYQGNPAEKILETALVRETDLIVLGVKEEVGVPGASTHLPIATAHKVVSRATCPVLTVRS